MFLNHTYGNPKRMSDVISPKGIPKSISVKLLNACILKVTWVRTHRGIINS